VQPPFVLPRLGWLISEPAHPRLVPCDCAFGESPGSGLDELLAFVDRLAVLLAHLPQRLRDETSDEPRARPATARRGRGDPVESIMQDGGDVASVVEPVLADDPRHEGL
jgi:hypothetical protein